MHAANGKLWHSPRSCFPRTWFPSQLCFFCFHPELYDYFIYNVCFSAVLSGGEGVRKMSVCSLLSGTRVGLYHFDSAVSSAYSLFWQYLKKNVSCSWPCHTTCGILVPQPGIKPMSLALEAQSLNHSIVQEVSIFWKYFDNILRMLIFEAELYQH